MKSGDNQEYEMRTREARREGLFYLAIVVAAGLAGGLLLRWWPQ
ncbi:hypothetical protein [Bosea minatitlanensis]|uniref:Uncharacterized protein n=1 Tax=Bosea minatitlanensis TaxID=128782 RepID=A0ABW0EYU2_9HYPH|nr:hypothetical protein [Bosea minatitlanensis]MCT4491759.1 hypothetical protein [Bosea minatitlanensis]